MHERTESSGRGTCRCLDEIIRGNLRIRMYELGTDAGIRFGVEVVACNGFLDQRKLLDFVGGLDRRTAERMFAVLSERYRGYCWMDGEYVTSE